MSNHFYIKSNSDHNLEKQAINSRVKLESNGESNNSRVYEAVGVVLIKITGNWKNQAAYQNNK